MPVFDSGLNLEIQRHNYEDIDRPTDLGKAQAGIPFNPTPFLQILNRDQSGSILSTPSPFMRPSKYGNPHRTDNIPPQTSRIEPHQELKITRIHIVAFFNLKMIIIYLVLGKTQDVI